MALSLLKQGIIGSTVAGTAVIAGALYFGLDTDRSSTEQVENKQTVFSPVGLIKEKNPDKRLIDLSLPVSDKAWKEAWSRYRNANKTFNSWGVDGWTEVSGTALADTNAPEDFISKCSEKGSSEVFGTGDSLYSEVVNYCTRATLVRDLIKENLAKEGKTLLGTDDHAGWSAAWERYKLENKVKQKGKDKWGLQDWETNHNSEIISYYIKDTCNSKLDSEADSVEHENYKGVVSWCTK